MAAERGEIEEDMIVVAEANGNGWAAECTMQRKPCTFCKYIAEFHETQWR
jgi:hypothetical protein